MAGTLVPKKFTFKQAATVQEFADGRALFQQYAATLDFDLNFQDFASELENLASYYYMPTGGLQLAYDNHAAIGCAAIRAFNGTAAELKRMFVKPDYRGLGVGKRLLTNAINSAMALGYSKLLLDTLPDMQAAIAAYRAFGFVDIEPYRYNPLPGAVFMEKVLR